MSTFNSQLLHLKPVMILEPTTKDVRGQCTATVMCPLASLSMLKFLCNKKKLSQSAQCTTTGFHINKLRQSVELISPDI